MPRNREEKLEVWLTSKEKEKLAKNAKEQEISISEFVRDWVKTLPE